MPIFIKCIIMLWALGLMGLGYDFLFIYANPEYDRHRDGLTPMIRIIGFIHLWSLIAIIPFCFWLIFLR